jgi:hypothetical protein
MLSFLVENDILAVDEKSICWERINLLGSQPAVTCD